MEDHGMSRIKESGPVAAVLRRVGPVLAGLLTTVVLSVATDAFMHSSGIFPPLGQPMHGALFLLALAYRSAFGVLGGLVTGRLARPRPMRHVAVLATIGVVLSALGAIATWDAGPEFGPKWYPLAVVLTAFPTTWWGGLLAARRR
jgi:hypothetical protein